MPDEAPRVILLGSDMSIKCILAASAAMIGLSVFGNALSVPAFNAGAFLPRDIKPNGGGKAGIGGLGQPFVGGSPLHSVRGLFSSGAGLVLAAGGW